MLVHIFVLILENNNLSMNKVNIQITKSLITSHNLKTVLGSNMRCVYVFYGNHIRLASFCPVSTQSYMGDRQWIHFHLVVSSSASLSAMLAVTPQKGFSSTKRNQREEGVEEGVREWWRCGELEAHCFHWWAVTATADKNWLDFLFPESGWPASFQQCWKRYESVV